MISSYSDLTELRKEIDSIDDEIIKLLTRRFDAAKAVALYKKENGLPIFQSGREDEVLQKTAERSRADISQHIVTLYKIMMDMSKSLQYSLIENSNPLAVQIQNALIAGNAPLTGDKLVACQGTEGSFSHSASDILFKDGRKTFYAGFSDVFKAVKDGTADFGLLPIENSNSGSVDEVYNLIQEYNFYIVSNVKLSVSHCLLAKPGIKLEDITKVYSKDHALNQCSGFFKAHPDIIKKEYSNTAAAAKFVAQSETTNIAAIADKKCAELYRLNILYDGLQDNKTNFTRFICISRDLIIPETADKISIIIRLPHRTGSLFRVLSRFAAYNLNLTKIESRHIAGSDFEFLFYLDFIGSLRGGKVEDLLFGISGELEYFRFLGNYNQL